MKLIRRSCREPLVVLFGILACTQTVTARNFFDILFPGNELEAITVTELTPAAMLRRQPTPERPIYYAGMSGGFVSLGGVKAGEKPIARKEVNRTILKALAKEGYLPATAGHAPEIILVWRWGTFNRAVIPGSMGYDIQVNRHQMLQFLGGEKLGLHTGPNEQLLREYLSTGLEFARPDVSRLNDVATDDLYFAIVSAYDVVPGKKDRPVLLWQTRISAPARGFWLPDALPSMLAMAHPYIGRETKKPVWIRATDKFRPDIKLGDTKLLEYIENSQSAVLEAGRAN